MAVRPVFQMKNSFPYYEEINVDFKYSAGFALVQRQKNIAAIHEAYHRLFPDSAVLEASSKAPTALGKALSPFYLTADYEGGIYPVENIFQSCKVFSRGGPYPSLLQMEAIKAKTTSLTKTSGPLLYYEYNGLKYPLDPKGWFYNWLYMKALEKKPELIEQAAAYNAFTDIAFNPKTGFSCQAKALAIFFSLRKKGLLEQALSSMESFLKILYKVKAQ